MLVVLEKKYIMSSTLLKLFLLKLIRKFSALCSDEEISTTKIIHIQCPNNKVITATPFYPCYIGQALFINSSLEDTSSETVQGLIQFLSSKYPTVRIRVQNICTNVKQEEFQFDQSSVKIVRKSSKFRVRVRGTSA